MAPMGRMLLVGNASGDWQHTVQTNALWVGNLAMLGPNTKVEAVMEASRGTVEITSARPLASIQGWRAMFDIRPTDDSLDPINLRMYLKSDGQPLSETWIYQWTPPAPGDRKF